MNRVPLLLSVAGILMIVTGAGPATAQTGPHGSLPNDLDCAACHTSESWAVQPRQVKFDHNRAAQFRLEGRHQATACRSCHLTLRFDEPKLATGDCAGCHADVHRGAFSERCTECHTPTTFHDVPGVALHAKTSFPLTGAHLQIACRTCHVDDRAGAFTALDADCLTCHRNAYDSGQQIDHVALGFPTDCRQCHSTLAWTNNGGFDHVALSRGFPLEGAHARLRCISCHTADLTPRYSPSGPNDCIACHDDDYQRKHGGSGFPTACLTCHTVNRWGDRVPFDHGALANGFALVGAHAQLPCTSCHSAADMTPLYTPASQNDCIACHDDDYQREHTGSGFPTTCLSCHTVDSWGGATFAQHDPLYFPIFSGKHRGKWNTCQDCHTQSGDFRTFSCFACHQQAKTDEQHRGRPGYRYDSNACYSCHPRGST